MIRARAALLSVIALTGTASPVVAQLHGNVSVTFDVLPDLSDARGRQSASELRTRLFAERRDQVGEHVRLTLSGYVDGLLADRGSLGASMPSTDAVARPSDLFAELTYSHVDLRLGFSRVVWGRLDEFQPTDVVNPLDLTRFLLDGRTEARLSVPLVGARVFLPHETAIDAIAVPAFVPARFDQLEERTSPFNVGVPASVVVRREEPATTLGNLQGGVRVTSTVRRLDWGVSAYRGFRSFPILAGPLGGDADATQGAGYVETFPRFTMLGGDFETVHGEWGIRGEAAAFVDDTLQVVSVEDGAPRVLARNGHSLDAGVGVDRRAGDYRIAGDVLWSYRSVARSNDSDVTLVASAERRFAADTRAIRVLGVYDPGNAVFVRTIVVFSLRDDVSIEGSGGLFTGSLSMIGGGVEDGDTLARFARRDFLYARLRVAF
jgi:hypothetical protein